MTNPLSWIPGFLIALRGFLGLSAVVLAVSHLDPQGVFLATFVVVGVLTDVFDGVIARRLKVSTDGLRVWDSRVDVLFFVSLVVAEVAQTPALLLPMAWLLGTLGVLEASVHGISFVRFGRQSSTHHYLSKAFSVLLFGLLVQLFLVPEVTWFYGLVLVVGVLSFGEAAWIMLRLPEWRCDVKGFWDVGRSS